MPQKTVTSNNTRQKKDYFELSIPKASGLMNLIKKNNFFSLILVLLLMLLSFATGAMYTKITYLEQGGGGTPTITASTVQDAFVQYAKQLGMDTKKFQACYTSKKYVSRMTNDIAEFTKLGFPQATPAFFIDGKYVGGAFPYAQFKEIIDKEIAGTGSENYKDYSAILQQAYESTQGKAFEPVPVSIPLGDSPMRGDKNAKVTIVEFSDFQCPYCKQAFGTINQVLQDYKGQVRLVYKHLPIIQLHPNSEVAAQAAECAREQNKFWELHDLLFTNQTTWAPLPQAATASPAI